jgi:phosphoesterase RecJ-like protein
MKKNNSCSEIIEAILRAKNILVVTHINPDGDCLGSAVALYSFLKNEYNKEATLFLNSKLPDLYKFLPNIDKFKMFEEIKDTEYDTVIAIDCAAKDRLVYAIPLFDKAQTTINIDHHKTNPMYAQYNYVYGDKSSSGEVLTQFAKESEWKFDRNIANGLYVAILTDTGGFKFENTTSETFLAVAELMKYGINPCLLYKCCYESKPLEMVKLSACAIMKSEFINKGKVAYTIITLDDMKQNKALNEHTDGIVEMLRQVNSVDIAFVIKETDEGFSKISLRSKNLDVSKIAMKFNGGGHSKAAGCTIKKNYNVALNKMIESINEEYFNANCGNN